MAGVSPVIIRGVPEGLTTVTSSASFLQAIQDAKPGAQVKLSPPGGTPVTPFALDLTAPKDGVGCDYILNQDQVVKVSCSQSAPMNTRLHGGRWEADVVDGAVGWTSAAVNGRFTNAKKLGLYSFGLGRGFAGLEFTACSDIDVGGFTDLGGRRDDCIRVIGADRLKIDGGYSRYGEAYRLPFAWDPTGAQQPSEYLSQSQASAQGMSWVDASHQDMLQYQDNVSARDITFTNNNFYLLGQGMISHNYPINTPTTDHIVRGLFANNTVALNWSNALICEGQDITVRDNLFGRVPNSEFAAFGGVLLQINRVDNTRRWMGGRNGTIPGLGTMLATVDGVTNAALTAGTIGGDLSTVQPTAPAVLRPPWMPAISRPAFTAPAAEFRTGPLIYWGSVECYNGDDTRKGGVANPTTSQPMSARPGILMGMVLGSTSYEWRWKSNGTIINGATTRTLSTAGRSGQTITLETRASVDGGSNWTPWIASIGIPVA